MDCHIVINADQTSMRIGFEEPAERAFITTNTEVVHGGVALKMIEFKGNPNLPVNLKVGGTLKVFTQNNTAYFFTIKSILNETNNDRIHKRT